MLKSDLKWVVERVDQQLASGQITQEQHQAFMAKVHEHMTYRSVEEPVWTKPRRPITPPRAHKNGAWKKYLQDA